MCIRDSFVAVLGASNYTYCDATWSQTLPDWIGSHVRALESVSYTHLRAHETVLDLVCRLLLEKKKRQLTTHSSLVYYTTNPHC